MRAPALIDGATCVAVSSGKGGVGKSTTTAAIALALAARGHDVLALDADTTGSNLHHLLDVADLTLNASREPLELILPEAHGVRLMSTESFGKQISPRDLISAARFAAMPEYVIVDLPAGWGADHAAVAAALPDLVVAVVAPTATALADHVTHRDHWNSGWADALRELRNHDKRRKWAELADEPAILEVETMARFCGINEATGEEVTIRRSDAVSAEEMAPFAQPTVSLPAAATPAALAESAEIASIVDQIVELHNS